MSNPGDWIAFPTLVARCQAHGMPRSPRTLRRYYQTGVISYRQAGKKARVEFNWDTVRRELRLMDNASVTADRAALLDLPPAVRDPAPDVFTSLTELTALVHQIARKVGVEPPAPFAAEHTPARKTA